MIPRIRKPTSLSRIVLATTVSLSFISLWRAAAIVLSDLASSMFYAGGVTEQAVGKAAPWLILAVTAFSFALRFVYLESCGLYVRGGGYVVVRDSMGKFMAKLSVSVVIVDFLLTGPISAVSAGYYLVSLYNDLCQHVGFPEEFIVHNTSMFAVVFALVVTGYFWRLNIHGVHESSSRVLAIVKLAAVMVIILLVWSIVTILIDDMVALPPLPSKETLILTDESLGWFSGTIVPSFTAMALIIAWGHAFLAVSGFETLAQVYRDIEFPKMKNLRIASLFVVIFAVLSTGIVTLFAVMIIPDDIRAQYQENLIAGLAMNLHGPYELKLLFQFFVVAVGALLLSGAVNTSIVGANGVLNRVAEDGIIFDSFRKPHPVYGTSYRIITMIAILHVITILLSQGDVYLLAEVYAFGVVWSFALKSLGVTVLRFQRKDQEYRTPLNLHIGKLEIPIGLIIITIILLMVALTNLFSKQHATIYGLIFTFTFFIIFSISEKMNAKKKEEQGAALEQFTVLPFTAEEMHSSTLAPRDGSVLVAVRDFNGLGPLKWALKHVNTEMRDIVVITVHSIQHGDSEYTTAEKQYFTKYEQELFSIVVTAAEKEGKSVDLMTVPAMNPMRAIVQVAQNINSRTLVVGTPRDVDPSEFARQIGLYWESLPQPKRPFTLVVTQLGVVAFNVNVGPHNPKLKPEDMEKLHDIWLELTENDGFKNQLHHSDIVHFALNRLQKDLKSVDRDEIIRQITSEIRKRGSE